MKKLSISTSLKEKIYDLKIDNNKSISKVTTYFPLNLKEKQEICTSIEKITIASIDFKSIFSDEISEQDWIKSKEQIQKKFQEELVDID